MWSPSFIWLLFVKTGLFLRIVSLSDCHPRSEPEGSFESKEVLASVA